MKTALVNAFIVGLSYLNLAMAQTEPLPANHKNMEIILTVNNEQSLTITLEDNQTAKDFLRLLPMTLTLKDYNGTEKVSDALAKKLSKSDDSFTPKIGDLAYYAPWGNLAIFYRDFKPSRGLFKIGTIQASDNIFNTPDAMTVKFELKK